MAFSVHPILQLKQDVLDFMEAIQAEPGSALDQSGTQFMDLLQELHDSYMIECFIEHIESCWDISECINQTDKF